jgi:hypothetical protein
MFSITRLIRLCVCLSVIGGLLLAAGATPPVSVFAQDSGFLILEDQFQDNSLGWEFVGTETNTALAVEDGKLRLSTLTAGFASWAVPEVTVPDNIDVQVGATVISPASSGNWNFGVIIRADTRDSTSSFYHFGVAGNGTYEFSIRRKGAQSYAEVLNRGDIEGFNARRPFRLRVTAVGNRFTYTINGREVGRFEDVGLESEPDVEKYVGLMVGTYENVRRNVVDFTNLQIFAAEGEAGNDTITVVTDPNTIFADDFAANTNGWRESKTENSVVEVGDGKLTIELLKENFIVYTWPNTKMPADIDVTVTVQNPDAATGAEWGYGIGYRGYDDGEQKTFYLFEVRRSGTYAITTQNGGKVLETLITGRVRNFDASAAHELRVVVKGDTHNFYVDGRKVSTVEDSSLTAQEDYFLILEAGTFADMPTMKAEFSNLVVKPAE